MARLTAKMVFSLRQAGSGQSLTGIVQRVWGHVAAMHSRVGGGGGGGAEVCQSRMISTSNAAKGTLAAR